MLLAVNYCMYKISKIKIKILNLLSLTRKSVEKNEENGVQERWNPVKKRAL